MTYLIQTTVFACLKNKSVAEVRFRDNFSVTSIFIVTAIFSVTENSSRAEFDNRLFSFQQPLRFAALSTSPYTGEAFTCGICTLHYQRNSILFCLFGFGLPTHYTGEANAPTDFICIISVIQYYFAYSAAASPCLPLTQGRQTRSQSPLILST